MTEEVVVPENGHDTGRRRRADDAQAVEVHGYGNGAKRNAIISTIAQVGTAFGSFAVVFAVIWWGSKIDTRQVHTIGEVATIREDQAEILKDHAQMAASQARTLELYLRISETLDRTVERLDETRDIATALEAIERERARVRGEMP